MIRGHLEEEKPANSTPKNVARGVSGGVLEGVLGVSEAGFLDAVEDDEAG